MSHSRPGPLQPGFQCRHPAHRSVRVPPLWRKAPFPLCSPAASPNSSPWQCRDALGARTDGVLEHLRRAAAGTKSGGRLAARGAPARLVCCPGAGSMCCLVRWAALASRNDPAGWTNCCGLRRASSPLLRSTRGLCAPNRPQHPGSPPPLPAPGSPSSCSPGHQSSLGGGPLCAHAWLTGISLQSVE